MEKCKDDDVISVSSDSSSGVDHEEEAEEVTPPNAQEQDKDVETLLSEMEVNNLILAFFNTCFLWICFTRFLQFRVCFITEFLTLVCLHRCVNMSRNVSLNVSLMLTKTGSKSFSKERSPRLLLLVICRPRTGRQNLFLQILASKTNLS